MQEAGSQNQESEGSKEKMKENRGEEKTVRDRGGKTTSPVIRSFRDLKVFTLAYDLSTDVFHKTKQFPREELYSLTDQIRRSSRSISVNIAEGWAKRHFENIFKRHLLDSMGSCDETKVWLDFALNCQYMTKEDHAALSTRCEEVSKMLYSLFINWKTFKK